MHPLSGVRAGARAEASTLTGQPGLTGPRIRSPTRLAPFLPTVLAMVALAAVIVV